MVTRTKRSSQERDVDDDQPTSSKRAKTLSGKRTDKAPDSIPWEVFYMSVAELESQRSNCVDSDKVTDDNASNIVLAIGAQA